MTSKEAVIQQLKTIYDPEIPVNIYDLGLIYNTQVLDDYVLITMTLTTATCPAAAFIPEEIKNVLHEIKGVKRVEVEVVYEPKWTKDLMSEEAKKQLGFN